MIQCSTVEEFLVGKHSTKGKKSILPKESEDVWTEILYSDVCHKINKEIEESGSLNRQCI